MSNFRLGVFGGSFDPPHNGHLICVRLVAEQLNLNKVLIIPTAIQPHKPNGAVAPTEARWRMVVAAVENDPLFEPSRIEIDRGGVSYTVDTLTIIADKYHLSPDSLYLIIGADALTEMNTWHQPRRIAQLARIVVMRRPNYPINAQPNDWMPDIIVVDTPLIDISSTWLRQRAARRLSLRWFVPDRVAQIIETENLYK